MARRVEGAEHEMTVARYRLLLIAMILAGVVAAIALARVSPDEADVSGDCGGFEVVRRAGTVWRCTFSDDFDGSAVDPSKWQVLTARDARFSRGGECTSDDERNVSVADGRLRLTVRSTNQPFTCPSVRGSFPSQHTGAAVSTWRRFDQTYGRFLIRARFLAAPAPGVQSAIWLWPSAQRYGAWPRSGEIDIAEYYTHLPDRVIPYVHYASNGVDPTVTNNNCIVRDPHRFHDFGMEWTPEAITIVYDGRVCLRTGWDRAGALRNPAPFDRPFYLNLTQALGVGKNRFDIQASRLPATMEVDHVYVWR